MDNNNNILGGVLHLIMSIGGFLFSIFSFLKSHHTGIAWAIGCLSGLVAIGSGLKAFFYYHHATKKLKKDNQNDTFGKQKNPT